jgi:lysophospholipase L1-like esterase
MMRGQRRTAITFAVTAALAVCLTWGFITRPWLTAEESSAPRNDAPSSKAAPMTPQNVIIERFLQENAPEFANSNKETGGHVQKTDIDTSSHPNAPSGAAEEGKSETTPHTLEEVPKPEINRKGGASTTSTRPIMILHIGDSHTAADFFTGEIRRLLQVRYGQGSTGYMAAGRPDGFRTEALKVNTTSKWSYKSLQKRDALPANFWLSGYDATATVAGETINYISLRPLAFSAVEIEVVRQPRGGAIDIEIDRKLERHYDLDSDHIEPAVIRVPASSPAAQLHELSIKTTRKGTTTIASVSVYNDRDGLTYSSVGYSGATIGILHKLDEGQFTGSLQRISPQIVVLSFGTNEAASENLDLIEYRKRYEQVLSTLKTVAPGAAIVMIAPPDFNQLSPSCPKNKASEATCRPLSVGTINESGTAPPQSERLSRDRLQCIWRTPAKLAEVRDVQHEIATRIGALYWDWASIMPGECGAHAWFRSSPPLMSPDHVHFTALGYRKSAVDFANVLIPLIDKIRSGGDVIPNN